MPAFRVKLGTSGLNFVDVPLNPAVKPYSLTHCEVLSGLVLVGDSSSTHAAQESNHLSEVLPCTCSTQCRSQLGVRVAQVA